MVEDGGDAGQRAGLLEIQLFDVGVGNGAAEHAAVEHVGHVIVRGKLRAAEHLVERVDLDMVTAEDSYVSHASASSPLHSGSGRSTALIDLGIAGQRQRLPLMASLTSSRVGLGFFLRKPRR